MSETFEVTNGYDRRKNPGKVLVRHMTIDELKNLNGSHVSFISVQGVLRQAKVTSVKTWKTRPNEVAIGLKYGLYEYATLNTEEALKQIVKEVEV